MIRPGNSAVMMLLWLIVSTARADAVRAVLPQPPDAVSPLNVLFVIDDTRNGSRVGVDGKPLGQLAQAALAKLINDIDSPHINLGVFLLAGAENTGRAADLAPWALPGSELESPMSRRQITSPSPTPCAQNLLVFISLGASESTTAAPGLARAILDRQFGALRGVSRPNQAWLEWLANDDVGVTTFTIDVEPLSSREGRAWSETLIQSAGSGGGKYFPVTADAKSIGTALAQALAFGPTNAAQFAPVGIPLDAHREGVYSDRVYSGQFRPDSYGRPRWFGNLKQYRLGFKKGARHAGLMLLDADNRPAHNTQTGQINSCARSHWTSVHEDNYWQFLPESEQHGACARSSNARHSNSPDGQVVEKGGQAYVTRGGRHFSNEVASGRRIATTGAGFCGADTGKTCQLTALDAANPALTSERFGADDEASRVRLLNWARGTDTEDEDGDGNRLEYRPSVHGAVVHSQPLAIDYSSSEAEPRIVVFYGSDDGLLRAVNGNRAAAVNGVAAGGELWAFMPPEYHRSIRTNFDNPVTRLKQGNARHGNPYGPDGPFSTWRDQNGNRYLAMALRRGGSSLYGFDISDPAAPRLLWRLGCDHADDGRRDCARGWENTGQTWSRLAVAWPRDAEQPLLITGGGYDVCEDVDQPAVPANHACDARTTGNSIYILDALSGAVRASFATERAVPAGVTVVPAADGTDTISYAYSVDAGGNVYRLSGPAGAAVGETPPEKWLLTRIASLGCDAVSGEVCSANRKFLHRPDVVRLPGTSRYVLLLGSGDREKAAVHDSAAQGVANYLYAIEDDPLNPGWLAEERERCDQAIICHSSLKTRGDNLQPAGPDARQWKGWKQPLRSREQAVSPALTVSDIAYFNTYLLPQPDSGSCRKPVGIAARYALHYRSGDGEKGDFIGAGLLPAALAGRVVTEEGAIVPFCIGCEVQGPPGKITQPAAGVVTLPPKRHVYWRMEQ